MSTPARFPSRCRSSPRWSPAPGRRSFPGRRRNRANPRRRTDRCRRRWFSSWSSSSSESALRSSRRSSAVRRSCTSIAEPGLVLDQATQLVEPRADLVLQRRAPEIDHLLGGRRRRRPVRRSRTSIASASDSGASARSVISSILAAMEVIIEHRGGVLGNARHAGARRSPRPGPAPPPRTRRAPADCRASACDAALDRDRRASARSESAWPRTMAASRLVIFRAGSGSAPCRAQGRDARRRSVTSSSGALAIALRHDVTARLNGSVGASLVVAEFGVGGCAHRFRKPVPGDALRGTVDREFPRRRGSRRLIETLREYRITAFLFSGTTALSRGDQLSATLTADSGSSALKQR